MDEAEKIRQCLKIIRSDTTKPNDVLPNGLTASETAFKYVMESKRKRFRYKSNNKVKHHKRRKVSALPL